MQSLRTRLDQLPYARLFSIPGTKRFCAAAALARLPMSMMSLGLVLALNHLYNNWTVAGTMSAVFVLAVALVTPLYARLFDRFGQAKVGPVALAAQVMTMLALAAGAWFRVPLPILFVLAIANGLTQFSFGALVRTRWAWTLNRLSNGTSASDSDSASAIERSSRQRSAANDSLLNAAYSFEAAVDELIFIFGPILAAFLATSVHPVSQLFFPAVFAAVGGTIFFMQRSSMPAVSTTQIHIETAASEPQAVMESATSDVWSAKSRSSEATHEFERELGHTVAEPATVRVRSALTFVGVPALVMVFMMYNAGFSSFDVAVTALTEELGVPQLVGIQLALFAFGSLIGALVFGSVKLPGSHWAHMVVFLVTLTVWYVIFIPASSNLAMLGVCEVLAGVVVAPTFATANLLVKELVPETSLTEGLAWISTGTAVGGSLGSTIAGMVLDHTNVLTGLTVPAITCAAALTLASIAWWRRHSRNNTTHTLRMHHTRSHRRAA